jgi:hypothetical protein
MELLRPARVLDTLMRLCWVGWEMKAILSWWWHKRMARAITMRLAMYRSN